MIREFLLDLTRTHGFLFGLGILAALTFALIVRHVGLRRAIASNVGFWKLAAGTAAVPAANRRASRMARASQNGAMPAARSPRCGSSTHSMPAIRPFSMIGEMWTLLMSSGAR